MGKTALVTGSSQRMTEVSSALEKSGFAVTMAGGTRSEVESACASMAPGTLDCYVQLPRASPVSGETLVGRVHQFLEEGLLTRFEATGVVLPLLAPDACVVLVAGNIPGETTPDDRHARIDLLRVLARAILADSGSASLRAIVVGYDRPPEEIIDIVLSRGADKRRRQAQVASLSDEMDYADWQREYLSLTTDEE